MHDVLHCLFDTEIPFELSQYFSEITEVHDSPESGLYWDGKVLAFHWYDEHHQSERREVFDFNQILTDLGRKLGPPPKELLGKALGKEPKQLVWDLTGGTGRDALSFYLWGHDVHMFERNIVTAALLIDALRRAPELKERLQITFGEAAKSSQSETPDAIYYDPMFPEDVKKSRPKKEMALFKILTSGDDDQEEVLNWALNSGAKRIILKRPVKAQPTEPKATAVFKGKTVRFDLFQR
ncbi:MAG: 16S rRNA (guanine1516-N2)-methyltransferase [Bacteriovoracaceae bacterium]|jgi:16S rRNA (guanine1516-N2)-methyltransferase